MSPMLVSNLLAIKPTLYYRLIIKRLVWLVKMVMSETEIMGISIINLCCLYIIQRANFDF